MKSTLRFIFKIIFLIVFALFAFTGFDYYRMTKGLLPVFQTSTFNSSNRVQTFHGTFYTASRKVRANQDELLEESSDVQFYLFQIPISIEVEKNKFSNNYKMISSKMENCNNHATLYYADLDIKVYTVCLSDLQIDQ